MSEREDRQHDRETAKQVQVQIGLGGLLKGVVELVGGVRTLKQEESDPDVASYEVQNRKVRGVYGVSVQMREDNRGRVEPFGNIHQDAQTGQAVVGDVFEPMVDVFEEADHTLIVAEMPGVGADDVQLEVQKQTLTFSAARGEKKYRKQMQLSHPTAREGIRVSSNNGVVELKCLKKTDASHGQNR